MQVVVEDPDGAGDGEVPRPLAEAVDRGMDALDARPDGLAGIGSGKVVVVVGMEIEADAGVALHHHAAELRRPAGFEDAERVREHHPLDGRVLQGIDEEEHVGGVAAHPVRPVFQIDVDPEPPAGRRPDVPEDVVQVLLRAFPELAGEVAGRAFREKVHHPAACGGDPVDGGAAVHEAEGLDGLQPPAVRRPGAHAGKGLLLAAGNPCRAGLDAVDLQLFEEETGDGPLLVGVEGNARRLFPVAQGGVHYFDHRFSKASIFPFCNRR